MTVPLLVVQGDRDPFGTAADFPGDVTVCEVAGADHRLAGPALRRSWNRVRSWLLATASRTGSADTRLPGRLLRTEGNRCAAAGVVNRRTNRR